MIKASTQFGWDTAKVWALTGLSAASILTIALLLRNGAAETPSQTITPVSFSASQSTTDGVPGAGARCATDRVE